MNNIRFFYNGKNLDEGKKYFKSSSKYTDSNIQDLMNEYKTLLEYDKDSVDTILHPATCPAMNGIKGAGWTVFNHYELTAVDLIHMAVTDLFPNYPNSNDYYIVKYESEWSVNIPTGYYLTLIPTLYHTGNWFSLPGIIDPTFKESHGVVWLSSFIFIKKGEVIPVGSPIAQFILTQKEIPNVIIELANQDDVDRIQQKQYLMKLKKEDYKRYKLVRNSENFKNL